MKTTPRITDERMKSFIRALDFRKTGLSPQDADNIQREAREKGRRLAGIEYKALLMDFIQTCNKASWDALWAPKEHLKRAILTIHLKVTRDLLTKGLYDSSADPEGLREYVVVPVAVAIHKAGREKGGVYIEDYSVRVERDVNLMESDRKYSDLIFAKDEQIELSDDEFNDAAQMFADEVAEKGRWRYERED